MPPVLPCTTRRRRFAGTLLVAAFGSLASAQSEPKTAPTPPPSGGAKEVQASSSKRGYFAPNLFLELSGATIPVRRCESVGQRLAQAASRTDGGKGKTPVATELEPIELHLSSPLDPSLASWVAEALAGTPRRQDAALLEFGGTGAADEGYASRLRDVGVEALVVPSLDASSKESFEWNVRLGGAKTLRWEPLSGKASAAIGSKQKSQLISNFRLRIDGVSCETIGKIGPIEVLCGVPATGDDGGGKPGGGAPVIKPFTVEIGDRDAADWVRWFDDVATKGSAAARNATIELLDASMKEVTTSISLTNVVPTALRREFSAGGRAGFVAELSAASLKVAFPKN